MVKVLCVMCENEMTVEIIPCGKTAFLEAECSKCGNAIDQPITAKSGKDLASSNKTLKL